MDFQILITNPELAKNITLQVKGNDLLEFANTLVEATSQQVEQRLKEQNKPDELLTRQQVAEILGVTLTTLWNYEKKEILVPVKIGNKVRYLRSDIQIALKSKKR